MTNYDHLHKIIDCMEKHLNMYVFNRFEKQWISYDITFSLDIAERASAFVKYMCKYFRVHSNELKDLFCGFNQDTIPSAISYLYASKIITPQNNANVDINTELIKLFLKIKGKSGQ
ncbi:hypothetical protein RFI_38281 [Reticulomyxa filosa]|uniref:Uncharacterized protein n=1 Tax=Reticulomyxa filosa TaxID=46433 RepID=X6LCU4_RETFI|nr:hypothetical protein RFI_38281 [Reticulomyxa filosa]|eukprot:ETN99200.1 hypothetical protein RFI_38281 [Reticulomyxa filosa]